MTNSSVYFSLTLELAEKAKWICKPNPAVGAVIIKQGRILSLGYTQSVGGSHAEIEALSMLKSHKSILKNSSLYVSLMPCSFTGRTPPCTNAIIKSGIREVHVALLDNDPRIKNARGENNSVARLRSHGIKVIYDCPIKIAQKLFYLNWDYYKKNATGLPSFTLKYAMSGDGKIAPSLNKANKQRLVLSNPVSKLQVHEERAQHEAILVGGHTLIADNPQLNVRIAKATQTSFKQPVKKFAWKTPVSLFSKKVSTAVPFKGLLAKLQQPTPLVLSRSDITKQFSIAPPIALALLNKTRLPAPLFIVSGKHKATYRKLSPFPPFPPLPKGFPKGFFWNSKSGMEPSSSYNPTQTEFWKDFSQHTNIYSIYVEGGAELQHLLATTGLFDRVSIYLTSRFLFDSAALSPFTSSKNKHRDVVNTTSLWQTQFIVLDDNVCMRGFLNQNLVKKIWRKVYPGN